MSIKFLKEANHFLPKTPLEAAAASESQKRTPGLHRLDDISGFSAVFMSGSSPSLIVRTSKSLPHVIGVHGDLIRGITCFDSVDCEKGLLYIDQEVFLIFANLFA